MKPRSGTGWIYALMAAIVIATVVGAVTGDASGNEGVCDPQSDHITPEGDVASVTATAMGDRLITGYCVKAGSIHQGLGPEYVTLDPPARTVTIAHSSGKDISHFVVYFEDPTPTTTTIPATTTTETPDVTTTTVPSTTTTEVPEQPATTVTPESPHDPPPSSDSADPVPATPGMTG